MSKKIQKDVDIYVAPQMLGKYEDIKPVVIDERNNNEKLDPDKIEHKIKIYEREVKEWFLEPATALISSENQFNNSFIVLMICMSYIEGVEQYKTGEGSSGESKKFFTNSIKKLYPDKYSDDEIEELYSKSRCGLFHNGMVKGGVIFDNSFNDAIEFKENGERININPTKLLDDIKNDFEKYINKLNDESNIRDRKKFDERFSVL